jgi:hypothetical protein
VEHKFKGLASLLTIHFQAWKSSIKLVNLAKVEL